ncbi:right-handed parallel beta-helix repeat-containing protein [Halosimplex pelagicum]|uniref:Right-handed parallel beta-helix repeat-containing protein n=1 Tax=Halosimplex pelagicum TaxID=869886 RepID=A0A7D5SUC5_9EURY|nr:right-handed parallel beta-helix repeat-containing protein [Halosimplex pelagicum]QLH81187.1 right-handed parallel beta-helix repeat-containing protein [Halosimplex pelagicum]
MTEKEAHNSDREDTNRERTEQTLLNRRSYLKTGAAAVAALGAGIAGQASAAVTRHEISFDRVVNAVDDLGADPSGGEPVNDAFDVAAGTLVEVPEGTYQFDGRLQVSDRVGFVGTGEAAFRPPEGFNGFLLESTANRFLLESIDFDIRAADTTTAVRVKVDRRFHLEDIEFVGRGSHPDQEEVNALTLSIGADDGTGIVNNVRIPKIGVPGKYKGGEGRAGSWVGSSHAGTIRFVDCDMREAGNNALYCSRNSGNVQVVGGYWENNSPASVRLSGDGSYVEDATLVTDIERYDGPELGDQLNPRPVVVEQGWADKPAGCRVSNCDIAIRSGSPQGGIVVWPTGRSVEVVDTRIRVDSDGVPAVRRYNLDGFQSHDPKAPPHWVRMVGCSITGSAAGGCAIDITDGDASVVENSCIQQTGGDRDGIRLRNCTDNVVRDSTVDVTGEAVVADSASVSTSGITNSGSCPVPNLSGDSSDSSSGNGSSGDGSTDGSSGDGSTRTLTIDGSDADRTDYRFSVDGTISPTDSIGDGDTIDGTTATGFVNGGTDRYEFTGPVTDFTRDGDAIVLVDGQQVDPTELGGYDHVIEVLTTEDPSELDYTFTTTGEIERNASEDDDSTEENDSVTENGDGTWTVDGYTGNGYGDSFRFNGEVASFSPIEPFLEVRIDGEVVDPTTLGSGDDSSSDGSSGDGSTDDSSSDGSSGDGSTDDSSSDGSSGDGSTDDSSSDGSSGDGSTDDSSSDGSSGDGSTDDSSSDGSSGDGSTRTLTIDGSDADRTDYRFNVDGSISPTDSIGDGDTIDGTTATGFVNGGTDRYEFTGSVTDFTRDGDATVLVDGQQVDPAELGVTAPDLPNSFVVDGTGDTTEYEISVSGELAKDPTVGTVDEGDTVDGSQARGSVDDETDGYRFSGDVDALAITGAAAVTFRDNDG